MTQPLQIAIDGPVAAGKGDIAARLSREFRMIYIYTGAMYRVLALACIRAGITHTNKELVLDVLHKTKIELMEPNENSKESYKALLNGDDVTSILQNPDVSKGSSDVATIAAVRREMVARQKMMAQDKRVVMEGRDIGLRVLPQAQLKIYLTASIEERAKRRFEQWQKKGIVRSFEETLTDTKSRDEQDMKRASDPLQKLPDAWELDTTGMTQEQVVKSIKGELQRRGLL